MSNAPHEMPVDAPQTEFSHAVDLRDLRGAPGAFDLAASPSQCALIAKRLGVPGVSRLEGRVTLKVSKTEIIASGVLKADLTRECVASLEEMAETVEDAFEVGFLRAAPSEAPEEDEAEDWDAPEVHEGDIFDLGEFLTQQLALAMEPFPRKPGAVSLAERYGEDKPVSPFADLASKIRES